MNPIDPLKLDQQVQSAVRSYRQWRWSLRADPEQALEQDPLAAHRGVSTRAVYQAVQQLPGELPTREPLLRWVAALTLDRVTLEDLVELDRSRRLELETVRSLGRTPFSVRGLVLEAAAAAEPERRELVARALVERCDDASSNALFWLARRHEAARVLGLGSLGELESPTSADLSAQRLAQLVLERTQDVAREALGKVTEWQEAVHQGAAPGATQGWPAHLTWRWMQDLVSRGELLEGLDLALEPLPVALTGSSFARALARFGSSFCRACARRPATPFCLAVQPFDARPCSYASLFASWLTSMPFLKKHLGLGSGPARDHARAFACSMLVTARLGAAQTQLASCVDAEAARETHCTLGSRALLCQLPTELAGVLPRYRPTAAARLVGMLHAATLREQLVEQFDEDWFDNPRAQRRLREVDVTTRLVLDTAATEQGADALARLIGQAYA